MADTRMYPTGSYGTDKSRKYQGLNIDFGVLKQQRTRVTAAQVNAGFTLLPAVPGVKWRIADCAMIAIGGAAATATSVDLLGTKSGSASRPVVNAVAGLTQSAVLRMGASNSAVLTDGASFTAHDANTAISVTKQSGGSNLATATHIDVLLSYVADPA
jgi:hypothetical protein